ncbi:Alpha-2-macroglobulin-like protein 1, partial [Larimichthys crocea]
IRVYKPMTFIQTDKPIYLPGQTVHFRVITLDTKLRPANQLYNIIEIKDAHQNRIGQWLNKMSNGKILQLSYPLHSEANEGIYILSVSVNKTKTLHSFKVDKYVLPRFDVKINAPDEISIIQEEFEAEVCAKYTYRQSVAGSVDLQVCQPLERSDKTCYKETKQADMKGCTTFTIKMTTFKKLDQRLMHSILDLSAKVEEEGTGISFSQEKKIQISFVVGKLSFIDTPKLYDQGSTVEGKIKAVLYNNRPIPDMLVYLHIRNSSFSKLQNLTTDSDGVAAFSFSTADVNGDIRLLASPKLKPEIQSPKTPFYLTEDHTLSMARPSSPETETMSSLEVKRQEKTLPCDSDQDIFIKYTVVGEAQGSVDVMYLVLSRGAIVMQGLKQAEVLDKSVTEGEVSFKLKVSAEIAPVVQVVAYAVLPSETVIANSSDFSTEKCFSHKVSLEFSPSSAVPGEETTMQMTAQPDSLCGVSAVDQSVLIKEPGETLNADKVFDMGMYPQH